MSVKPPSTVPFCSTPDVNPKPAINGGWCKTSAVKLPTATEMVKKALNIKDQKPVCTTIEHVPTLSEIFQKAIFGSKK